MPLAARGKRKIGPTICLEAGRGQRVFVINAGLELIPLLSEIESRAQEHPWDLAALMSEFDLPFSRIWAAVSTLRPARPLGFICFRMLPGGQDVDELYIPELSVAPEFQRRGIGSMLLDLVLRYGRVKGAERVVLDVDPDNEAAVGLYLSRGFSFVGGGHRSGKKRVMVHEFKGQGC